MARRVLDFYRLQARLMWEWRPTRLAILRRAVLSFVGACLVLAITDAVLPGLSIDGPGPLLLAGLLLAALDSSSDVVLHWLFVAWPIFVAQTVGLAVQFVAIIIIGQVLPGVRVDGIATAVWGAVLLTLLNSLFAEVVSVSDDNSTTACSSGGWWPATSDAPGNRPGSAGRPDRRTEPAVLQQALRAGRVPMLGRLLRDGEATLHPWIALLPPTTPASQAGILHGRTTASPAFAGRKGRQSVDGGQPSGRCGRDRPSRQRRQGPAGRRRRQRRQSRDACAAQLPDHTRSRRARRPTTSRACAAFRHPSTTSACWR